MIKFFLCTFSVFTIAFTLPRLFNTRNTPENILKLSDPKPIENVELFSGQYQGDIVLNSEQWKAIHELSSKTGLINETYRWTNLTIPYELGMEFTTIQRAHILLGLADLEAQTCLKFVPRTAEHTDYIAVIGTASGCWSEVGRQGQMQNVNLQLYDPGHGCFRHGTIVHEFIHALGFFHMQSASDRDEYIRIVWENIQPGLEHNFDLYPDTFVSHFGVPYDYSSVMHYPATAFSVNGEKTIIALNGTAEIGQRANMTKGDIERINAMYGCAKYSKI